MSRSEDPALVRTVPPAAAEAQLLLSRLGPLLLTVSLEPWAEEPGQQEQHCAKQVMLLHQHASLLIAIRGQRLQEEA